MKTKVSLLLTGSELMNGDVIDTNSIMFAEQLNNIGLSIDKKVTVGDEQSLLMAEITQLSQASDILLINGGLGPTTDDLTAQVLSSATDTTLTLNEQAHLHLKTWAKKRNTTLNKPNLKQAYLPKNCKVIDNKTGSAVGFSVDFNKCLIICTPGVPSELAHMLKEEVIPSLKSRFKPAPYYQIHRLQTFGIGESSIQALVDENFPEWPNEIMIGFRAAMPILEVKLIVNCQQSQAMLPHWLKKLKTLLGAHTLFYGTTSNSTVAEYVVPQLIKANKKITVAESCTGGLIASQLTGVSGASAIFEAGFVTYSNKMKTTMLSVPETTLIEHGAVSKATVIAMAQGALINSDADFTIAVSGIAGPNGGTKDKPVGSVWVAWGDKNNINAKYYCIPVARKYFQQIVAARSLDLIRRLLIQSNEVPYYDK